MSDDYMDRQGDMFTRPPPSRARIVRGDHVVRSAYFSDDGRYRYALTRCWRLGPVIACIGLNPSTADAFKDDPTIASLSMQVDMMGFGTLLMLNAFAFKATKPEDMMVEADPVGPLNDETMKRLLLQRETEPPSVIVAWGRWGSHRDRDMNLMGWLRAWGIQPQCFAVTLTGQPRHPLYLPHGSKLIPYEGRT